MRQSARLSLLARHVLLPIGRAGYDHFLDRAICSWALRWRFFQRLVLQFDEPKIVITDKLRSYVKPVKTLAPDADHRTHKGLNNAIEVSHRPTRKREKIFGQFKSHRQAQRFLAAHDQINLIFRPHRYQLNATSYHHARNDAFTLWVEYTAEMRA